MPRPFKQYLVFGNENKRNIHKDRNIFQNNDTITFNYLYCIASCIYCWKSSYPLLSKGKACSHFRRSFYIVPLQYKNCSISLLPMSICSEEHWWLEMWLKFPTIILIPKFKFWLIIKLVMKQNHEWSIKFQL